MDLPNNYCQFCGTYRTSILIHQLTCHGSPRYSMKDALRIERMLKLGNIREVKKIHDKYRRRIKKGKKAKKTRFQATFADASPVPGG